VIGESVTITLFATPTERWEKGNRPLELITDIGLPGQIIHARTQPGGPMSTTLRHDVDVTRGSILPIVLVVSVVLSVVVVAVANYTATALRYGQASEARAGRWPLHKEPWTTRWNSCRSGVRCVPRRPAAERASTCPSPSQ
jgi:hypothetical protein